MIRTAGRSLLRQPSFTLAAAGTLAIGIAATTTLFTTVNAALLRPLPYAHPEELYAVRTYFPDGRFTIGMVGTEELAAVAAQTDVVSGVACTVRVDGTLGDGTGSEPRQIVAYAVSDGFFDLFGVPVQTGRGISAADDVRGAPSVVVLSHSLWQNAFGGRPDIVGQSIAMSGRPARVVGIAPAGFDVPVGTDVWTNAWFPLSVGHAYEAYVRARPAVPLAQLQARMNQTFASLARKYPEQETGRAYAIRPLLAATVGSLGPILLILFGATALLLVLAAVNVSNLMLARTTSRVRETAVRTALGASRGRIIAQLLSESVLVAIAGAIAGSLLAYLAVQLLLHFGAGRLPRLGSLSIDFRVAAFVAFVAGLTGVLIGIVPALRMADTDVTSLLNETGRCVRGSRKTRRLLGAFVVAEIAVAVAIVAGAGRLVRSYRNVESLDPGFNPRGLLVLDVALPAPQAPFQARRNAWWDQTEAALRSSGATAAAATSSLPLEPHEWDSTVFVDMVAHPDVPVDRRPNARLRLVTPDFFQTMGIRMLDGRPLTRADDTHSQIIGVVNEAFARRNLGGASPIGEQIKGLHGHREGNGFVDDYVRVVGVVRDVKYSALSGPTEPVLYVPFAQFVAARASIVIATADNAPERHAAGFVAALRKVEPRLAIEATPLSAIVAASLDRERLGMWLMLGFGVAALLLAAVGMFGVIAYVVSQQTAEMAVRQALGATRGHVVRRVMREGAGVASIGLAVGVGVAWWTGRLVAGYVFGVSARDPVVLGVSAASVGCLALAATWLPARRAAALELARALRET
ncbi:MAG TPA: ADOP family duplicated permease [Vicinamibacterales bacterium]|jgi:putative ABC transport system permease protein